MSIWVSGLPVRQSAVTVRRMQELDRRAIVQIGIPGPVLMENAGRGIAEVALNLLRSSKGPVVILCGKGNNGGDGFVTARYLFARGVRAEIWLLGRPGELSRDARVHFEIARKVRVPVLTLRSGRLSGPLAARVGRARLLIDALLGTGLSSPVREPYRGVIQWMNRSRKRVLAADVPSGLDADRGVALGVAVRAHATATCGYPKKGFFLREGPRLVGRLFVIDIGLPEKR